MSSASFLSALAARRSIYALGSNSPLSNEAIITYVSRLHPPALADLIADADDVLSLFTSLVQESIRQSPSSFNSQSSRAIVLLDDAHKKFWLEHIKEYGEQNVVAYMAERLPLFAAGKGTVLFFEDQAVIKGMQERNPAFAPAFPSFSSQSSGMAQINTWTALATEKLGANLQHIGAISGDSYVANLSKALGFPDTWKPYAELVFGSIEAPAAGEKSFIDDAERFRVIGA